MPRTSSKRQHWKSRYVHSKFLTSVEGTKRKAKRLSMGRRTTFSRNNSFLPRLSFKSRGKRETWRFGWRSRVKWCPWFVSKRILFLPFSSCFPASRTGCATALFQHGEVKRILSISFSLIERDDNSTCVNSIQNKKNKKKKGTREKKIESISRVKSFEVYDGGKKNIFRVIARDCFLSSSKLHSCETILSNRIEVEEQMLRN